MANGNNRLNPYGYSTGIHLPRMVGLRVLNDVFKYTWYFHQEWVTLIYLGNIRIKKSCLDLLS